MFKHSYLLRYKYASTDVRIRRYEWICDALPSAPSQPGQLPPPAPVYQPPHPWAAPGPDQQYSTQTSQGGFTEPYSSWGGAPPPAAAAGYGGGASDPGVGAAASTRGGPLPPVAGPTQAQAAALMAQRRRLSAPGAVGGEAGMSGGGGGGGRSLSGGRAVAAAERGRYPLRQVADAGNVKRGRSAAGVERERPSDGGRRASSAAGTLCLQCFVVVRDRLVPAAENPTIAWKDWCLHKSSVSLVPVSDSIRPSRSHTAPPRCRRCGCAERCGLPGPPRRPAGGRG